MSIALTVIYLNTNIVIVKQSLEGSEGAGKMTTNQPSDILYTMPSVLEPYVKAMQGASGLNSFDAVTNVLFAITTHIDLEQYPIVAYVGVAGSGKSSAMKQLFPMCKGAKWIEGTTVAAQRRELRGVRTAFVEEGDGIDTDLYTRRYSSQTGLVSINEPRGIGAWELQSYNIFGATVLHRRVSIGDVALRSRCIVIRTNYLFGADYHITPIGAVSAIASEACNKVKIRQAEVGGLDRVMQTWSPVFAIGEILGMTDWRKEALNTIEREASILRGGQGYEPSEAILQAIDILSRDEVSHNRVDKSVRVSEVVRVVRDEFAITLKPTQIREEAEAKGFQVGVLTGYPVIKVKKDQLDALLPE